MGCGGLEVFGLTWAEFKMFRGIKALIGCVFNLGDWGRLEGWDDKDIIGLDFVVLLAFEGFCILLLLLENWAHYMCNWNSQYDHLWMRERVYVCVCLCGS